MSEEDTGTPEGAPAPESAPETAPEASSAWTPNADAVRGFYSSDSININDDMLNQFIDIAAQHGLNEDAVKAIVGMDELRHEASVKASRETWDTTLAGWKEELEKDSLLTGGDGYEKNLETIAKVLYDYGGEKQPSGQNEFQEMLDATGLGNHPAMGRFLMKVAQALPQEGKPVGGAPARQERSPAEILFPNT